MTGWTFAFVTPRIVEIDPANSVFGICSVVHSFGVERDVAIEKRFSGLDAGCFCHLEDGSTVQFDASFRASFFGVFASAFCPGLESFSIPSTGEAIPDECFSFCRKLRRITFQSVSPVSVLANQAVFGRSLLRSICISSLVSHQ
jgi:hypothetical protein